MMTIRPALWYGLWVTLALSLVLAIGNNILTGRALLANRQATMTVVAQQGADGNAVVDSSDFLQVADVQAQQRGIRVVSYQSALGADHQGGGNACQIILTGAYGDLTQWLCWLEQQSFLQKITGFTLIEQGHGEDKGNKTMQLTIELLLMS